MLRSAVALAVVLSSASAARADRATPPVELVWIQLRAGIADGDAAAISGALATPLRYEGVAFTDDACARRFGVRGTVKAATLKRFAACLTDLLGARAVRADTRVHVRGDLTAGSPPRVNHLVVQYAVEDEGDGEEGGVEGGIEGGVVEGIGDLGSIPPPPPPPPPSRQNVPPNVVTPLIIAGSVKVLPDAKTAAAIQASGKTRVVVPVKLCFTAGGVPSDVVMLKSSGFPAYDAAIMAGFKAIRIRPFTVNGHAVPVCTVITILYAQP